MKNSNPKINSLIFQLVKFLMGAFIGGSCGSQEDDVAERGLQAILDEIHANSTGKVDIYFTPGSYSSLEGPIVLYAGMSIISKVE